MLSLRWFRRQRRPAPTFRPALLLLEDRTVPSASAHSFSHLPVPGPATHLQVIVPEQVQSGRSFQVEVEAEDASNQLATGYTGTVTFTLVPADTGATLPANYTFTSSDHGKHLFQVTLVATGSPTITVTDTTTSTITGSASTVVNPAPVATTLEVVTPEQAAMGVATCVTVEVLDQSGHIMTNFTGAVTLSSSDTTATGTSARHTTAASLPITYTFTASDHGKHTFQVTFKETAAATGTSTTVTAATQHALRFGIVDRLPGDCSHAFRPSGPVPGRDRFGRLGHGRGPQRFQSGGERLHRHGQLHQFRHDGDRQCHKKRDGDLTLVLHLHLHVGGRGTPSVLVELRHDRPAVADRHR